jgi:signal transduction histidine kinase
MDNMLAFKTIYLRFYMRRKRSKVLLPVWYNDDGLDCRPVENGKIARSGAIYLNMRLGYKLTGLLLIFTLSVTGFFYLTGLGNQKRNLEVVSEEHLGNIEAVFHNLEERDTKILFSTLEVIIQDPGMKAVYLKNNREKLYDYGQPLFQRLRDKYGITHFYFIRPNGHVFLRMHNRDIHGDLVERYSFQKSRDTGGPSWEIELGKTAFALRAVMPYYEDGDVIGYVELGEEIDHFLRILKDETKGDFGLFADKIYLDRADWRSTRRVAGLRDNWDDMEKHLVISSTGEGEAAEKCFVEENLEKAEEGESIFQQIRSGEKYFMCGGFDISDAQGRHIGALLSLTDITGHVIGAQKANNSTLLMALLMFAVTFSVGILVSRSITRPILRFSQVARDVGKGDLEQRVKVTSNDEIGETGRVFNDMIEKRKWVEDELKKATDELETRVKDRTAELNTANVSLRQQISERQKIEDELMDQNKFIRDAIDSLTHPFYVIDADDYTIKMANKASNFGDINEKATCFGLTHKRAAPCDSAEHPCPVEALKKTKEPVILEHTHYDADGKERVLEVYGYPVFDRNGKVAQIIEYNLDVTERKQREKELMRARSLEAIGKLAAGIAHEINTPLTNASLGMQVLSKRLHQITDESSIWRKIESVEKSIERSSVIARELLHFSRQKESEFIPLQINDLIVGAITLMEFRLRNIEIHQKLSDIPDVMGDPIKLEQVFLNILNNSAEAMPDGGEIFISTSLENEAVKIEVSDTGVGISEASLSRVFEPFFRIKETGHGSGLGLSISYSIINQHYGNIKISSAEGKGTTVTIQLPPGRDS